MASAGDEHHTPITHQSQNELPPAHPGTVFTFPRDPLGTVFASTQPRYPLARNDGE